MDACKEIQPILFRIAEGEASPDEAIAAAHHLSGCTVCRIRMARERRLGELIENELADVPVDAGFVDQVMARLPKEVPKPKKGAADKHKRGLKLACWAGLVALTGAGSGGGGSAPAFLSDRLNTGFGGLGDGRSWDSIAQSMIQGSLAAVQAWGSTGLSILPTRSLVIDLAFAGALLSGGVLAALLLASTMLSVAARNATGRA